jgi:hypothetical protein
LLTSLREELIKIDVKVVNHGGYVTFQMSEVEVDPELEDSRSRLARGCRAGSDIGSDRSIAFDRHGAVAVVFGSPQR